MALFDTIYGEVRNEVVNIFKEIEKFCRADLPKQLRFFINYHIFMAFHYALKLTTGFAFYDGKIYDPADEVECGLLTFHVIRY